MNDRSPDIWSAIARLHETIFGYHQRTGILDELRSQKADIAKNRHRIEQLEQFRRDLLSLKELARWLALAVAGMAGFLASDTAGKVIGNVAAILRSSPPS